MLWKPVAGGPQLVGAFISALAIAPANAGATYLGTNGGQPWKTVDGSTWSADPDWPAGVGQIVDLRVDPKDPAHVFATTGGNPVTGCVWELTSAAGTPAWSNITGDLPADVRATPLFADWRTGTLGALPGDDGRRLCLCQQRQAVDSVQIDAEHGHQRGFGFTPVSTCNGPG